MLISLTATVQTLVSKDLKTCRDRMLSSDKSLKVRFKIRYKVRMTCFIKNITCNKSATFTKTENNEVHYKERNNIDFL